VSDPLFVKHPDFPRSKCDFTPAGYFWKMTVREWAFAKVNLANMSPAIDVDSNNPTVVPGLFDTVEKKLKRTLPAAGNTMEVEFFANKSGFSFIYPFESSTRTPASALMQIQVISRTASSADDISLTKLEGKTVAINASDAQAYSMDTTLIFPSTAVNPLSVLSGVPSGANHVVLSSHGGVDPPGNPDKVWMWIGGFVNTAVRIDNDNATSIFATLKGKVANDCVIWFGGCNIGSNDDLCKKGAAASGCPVVAPVRACLNKKFPKGFVDLIDRFSNPVVFLPGSNDKPFIGDFCASQKKFKFVVPA
jgi:hypothetical protein